MNSKTQLAVSILVISFLTIASICCYVFSFMMLRTTMVSVWIPLAIAVGIAMVSGLTLSRVWRYLTDRQSFAINYIFHVLVVSGFLLLAVVLLNRYGASENASYKENAIVTRVYREKHYRTKRVSRRVYTRGAPYYIYMTDVELADGRFASFSIPKKRYDQLNRGDTIGVTLSKGLFRWDTIEKDDITYPPSKNKKKDRLPKTPYRTH